MYGTGRCGRCPMRDGVWEIRSVRPEPSIRVLGLFAEKDTFIATNAALREDLGGWQSKQWKDPKRLAKVRWRQLFNTYPPLKATKPKLLVSGAIDGKYFK